MASGQERRKKKRIQLPRGIVARFGGIGAVILDITDGGARIEHFNRLEVRKVAPFRFEWQKQAMEMTAEVRSCRIHRFAAEEGGTNVYQSGLLFTEMTPETSNQLRELVATTVARSLAEQVANARGLGPIIESESNMPVFRSGVVTAKGLEEGSTRFIPTTGIVADRGYLRCTLVGGNRFEKKWSKSPEQPPEGFTVSATEPPELVNQLCESYLQADEEQRKLIVVLAQLSVNKE
jgi:hypothetical protein